MDPQWQEMTRRLLETDSFKKPVYYLSSNEKVALSYKRAKAIGLAYNLSKTDIATLSKKFWNLHVDPIVCIDGAATTLLTIQYNLFAGTIAQYQLNDPRNDLDILLDDVLKFRKTAQFCLTELGHGLDVANLETTCTLLPSGEFCLHTPTPQAAKFMPPTIPIGLPCVAIVFARLLVGGKYCGARPFIVDINDGVEMCKGVSARQLPFRGGTYPVNHALTSFDKVILPAAALLGSLEIESFSHFDFLQSLWRVAIGSMALGSTAIPLLKVASTIGALYSARRHTGSESTGGRVPIINFRTQQTPILTAISQAFVLEAFHGWATTQMSDDSIDPRIRHGIAACFKAITVQHIQDALLNISERCGAQGLFGVNQMVTLHTEMRGIAIAEGDILGLSLRLAIELLRGRYELPEPQDRQSLLALHEIGLFKQYKELSTKYHHRSDEANRLLHPQCQGFVEAIGHRMAYDAAVADGVDKNLIDLYVASVVKLDPAWYCENLKMTTVALNAMEDRALSAVYPHLESFIRQIDCYSYVSAPITSDAQWDEFVRGLNFYGQGTEPRSNSTYANRGLHRL